jgi:predicted AAA+ superfamily ATPase
LSRRAVLYRVNGLSFREFLEFETGKKYAKYTLEEILQNHTQIAFEINEQLKPYELNISKLSQKIELNRATLYNYLAYLEAGHLTKMVRQQSRGDTIFTKPEKLYLNNTNLSYSYCENHDKGTNREIFFTNQVAQNHTIHYSKIGDFLVNEKYIFEIGGKDKSFKQIKDIQNSFVVADDIEVGFSNKIPLYLFGFLY